jgi:hypothetical protein
VPFRPTAIKLNPVAGFVPSMARITGTKRSNNFDCADGSSARCSTFEFSHQAIFDSLF